METANTTTRDDWPDLVPGEEVRAQYEHQLAILREHLEACARRLDEPTTRASTVEAAMHLRIVIEILALGSLILHGKHLDRAVKAMRGYKASDAMARVRDIHPNYWPIPYLMLGPNGIPTMEPITEGFLAEPEAEEAFGRLSNIIHARNPLKTPLEVSSAHEYVAEIHQKVAVLTVSFWADLLEDGIAFTCSLDPDDDHAGKGRLVRHAKREDDWEQMREGEHFFVVPKAVAPWMAPKSDQAS